MAGTSGHSGGLRAGSGRKSRAEELKLIEKLSPMEDKALAALKKGVDKGDYAFIKMYFEYYFGKPTENIALDNSGQQTLRIIHVGRKPD